MPLKLNDVVDDIKFEEKHLKALQTYFGQQGCPYYSLIHNGVKFNEHVGVLQVGNFTIEVLPKADKLDTDKKIWHGFLINMLRTVGFLDVEETGFSTLRLKTNSILDLYIELFLKEVRYLLQTGLVKKYRKIENNSFALKGALLFNKNIQQNLVHAERFYVKHSTYDRENIFNQVLYKTLLLIKQINYSPLLISNIESLLLDFPECDDIAVNDALFEKLHYDRKSESYRKAMGMAKLLLLNYHPDIRTGRNDVLALMFNMNKLWEAYVYKMLKKKLIGQYVVKNQVAREFWKPGGGRAVKIYPDIVVYDLGDNIITVLDTKWKNISGTKPSDDDLKQMFVYNLYYTSSNSVLLYPSVNHLSYSGEYSITQHGTCGLHFLPLQKVNDSYTLILEGLVQYIDVQFKLLSTKKVN